MTILAIDQGTSGTKALVQDDERVLAIAEHPVRPRYLDGGGVELDPVELLESVVAVGIKALAKAGNPPVQMVALANQGESVLAWDRRGGAPLSPVLVWQDRRADEVCRELSAQKDLIAARTGLVLDPYFSAPKMIWLRRHVTRDGTVTTTDSWLLHRLTGEFVTDATTASRSLVLNIDTLTWDRELLELFELQDEPMPTIVDNDQVVGQTEVFGASAPVGGLIVDQQAALVAQCCLTAGDAKCTYGTGAFLLMNTGADPVRSAAGLTTSAAWSVAGGLAYCLDAQAYTLGSALRWLTSLGLLTGAENLDVECADHSGGVTFVPALAGMAAPWWSAAPAGALLGMSLAADRRQVVRAVVDGLACQIAALVRTMAHDTGAPLTRLRVDGGLTQARVLMQGQADLLQIPIDCYPSPHATALGAAALGRTAVGGGITLDAAVPEWAPATTYEPHWSPDRAEETLTRWEACVDLVISRGPQT